MDASTRINIYKTFRDDIFVVHFTEDMLHRYAATRVRKDNHYFLHRRQKAESISSSYCV